MIEHTRREVAKILNNYNFSIYRSLFFFTLSLIAAFFIAFYVEYENIPKDAQITLFILIFAMGLWVTEAIPAFSVSLLIVGLEIILLGSPTHENSNWKIFIEPWSSSLIFLFLSGFILSSAAAKTKLDEYIAKKVLIYSGDTPKNILFSIMGITFIFSMFISNTATTAMVLAVILPIINNLEENNPFSKTLLLGVAIAANLGGMGTIIGTPPNAIAVGALGKDAPNFLEWMFYALPPALILVFVLGFLLLKIYPSSQEHIKIDLKEQSDDKTPMWEKYVVVITFIITLFLWLSTSFHHIPTAVVAFLPIVIFTISGIIDNEDIRKLPWDVLFLIMGGLSLGIAVSSSHLSDYIANLLPFNSLNLFLLLLIFAYFIVLVSNFMSNTAASNIIIPLVIAIITNITNNSEFVTIAVLLIALSASNAMLLPVSTPPNALVFATKKIFTKNFLGLGLLVGVLGPLVVFGWLYFIFFVIR